ncbi:DUF2927 domain-containing protein [Primorskyibacter aestuariivivens]|uniref:DUF2927 domain-containing protein n=1 Tax=Primorskyibacter aestuariivivens TaxID=1888912 RepID=UPI002301779F|nr:DUF2927 domain-containing protein [Primorskyibacter aestuariivivens]MDA7428892.1 DUF2927 domain-containing protein [Primorskyibacter aestuariivivens]
MRKYRRFLLPFYLMLSACMPVTPADTPTRAASFSASDLPAMKTFAVPRPAPALRSNSDIARDFLDLSFKLESGRALPSFSRFEGPITVRVTGDAPAALDSDLRRLLHRFRTEAQIPIAQAEGGKSANILIHAVSRKAIHKALPQAACFVVPNVTSLSDYKRLRRTQALNWARITERETISIFIPNDSSPQEMRDCLHEELAQSLGPLNDLYRLSDSVFNDDNVHTVLTGFDMLVLRATYDPALRSGMTRAEVAARLPGILSRINPRGDTLAPNRAARTPRVWIDAIETALGPGTKPAARRKAATEALQVASAMGWQDHRRAFSHYAMGRLILLSNPQRAKAEFAAARVYYSNTRNSNLHLAYVASQLAAYELTQDRPELALSLVNPHIDTAAQHENAALLATLMMIKAEALDLMGRVLEAREVRMDSLGWARYGFGPDWAVRAKLREIAALSPLKGFRG